MRICGKVLANKGSSSENLRPYIQRWSGRQWWYLLMQWSHSLLPGHCLVLFGLAPRSLYSFGPRGNVGVIRLAPGTFDGEEKRWNTPRDGCSELPLTLALSSHGGKRPFPLADEGGIYCRWFASKWDVFTMAVRSSRLVSAVDTEGLARCGRANKKPSPTAHRAGEVKK